MGEINTTIIIAVVIVSIVVGLAISLILLLKKNYAKIINQKNLKIKEIENNLSISIVKKGEIEPLLKENENFKNEISNLKNKISQLKENSERVSEEKELKSELLNVRKELEKTQKDASNYIKQQEEKIEKKSREIEELKNEIEKLNKRTKEPSPKLEPMKLELPKPEPVKPDPSKLEIKYTDIEKIEIYKRNILNLVNIHKFLEKKEFKNAEVMLKIIKKYEIDIEKLINKIMKKSPDKEDFSEEFTIELRNVVNKGIIEKLFDSLNYEIKKLDKNAIEFLEEIEKYFREIGFYSEEVRSGKKISSNDYDEYELTVEKTENPQIHDEIKTIERNPYYIDYKNSSGKRERICILGKMTIYSSKI